MALLFDRQIRYGTGVRYKPREDLEIGLSYEYLDLGKNNVRNTITGQGVVSGDYSPSRVQFISLAFSKSF